MHELPQYPGLFLHINATYIPLSQCPTPFTGLYTYTHTPDVLWLTEEGAVCMLCCFPVGELDL